MGSISATWGLVKNASSWVLLRRTEWETLVVGPSNLLLMSLPGDSDSGTALKKVVLSHLFSYGLLLWASPVGKRDDL